MSFLDPPRRVLKLLYWCLTFQIVARLRDRAGVRAIVESGLFDTAHYVSQCSEGIPAGLDPVTHYVRYGAAEGLDPSAFFDTKFYLETYPDVSQSKLNPLVHFIRHGAKELRNPNPSFDTGRYVARNPFVRESGINPLIHYKALEMPLEKDRRPQIDTWQDLQKSNIRALTDAKEQAERVSLDDLRHANVVGLPRLIAFYLPQFHPIPENNSWWGEGFTEWTNVTRATPLFPGHHQPRRPADLGYYDLRVPEVQHQQVALARQNGIHGFCYYYYWFGGRRLLERPMNDMLKAPDLDFPFCICWGNENWTRRWDGGDTSILMGQEHTVETDLAFIRDVIPILQDQRYIQFDGKPILLVYRPNILEDPIRTSEIWREECRKSGIPEIHLAAVSSFGLSDPRPLGFDSLVEFPPHGIVASDISKEIEGLRPDFRGKVYDYRDAIVSSLNRPWEEFRVHRSLMMSWDNTARVGANAHVWCNGSPTDYGLWLMKLVDQAIEDRSNKEPLIFINAWNEWAEGTYLEPDEKYGHAYLQETRSVLASAAGRLSSATPREGHEFRKDGQVQDRENMLSTIA